MIMALLTVICSCYFIYFVSKITDFYNTVSPYFETQEENRNLINSPHNNDNNNNNVKSLAY